MAQICYVTPDGWIQHDDTESFSAVTPSGWLQVESAVQPPAFTVATAKRWNGSAWVAAVVKRYDGAAFVTAAVKRGS